MRWPRTGLAIACLSLIGAVALLGPGAGSAAAEGEAPCPNEALRVEQHSTLLPDCRVYELVSPPAKSGGDVMPNSERTWASDDGDAIAFASLTAFGDAVGTGIATDYLAQRSTSSSPGSNGWATHAITPPIPQPLPSPLRTGGFDPMYALFSPGLSSAIFRSWTPLTSDPYVGGVPNLYVRSGLRGASPGPLALVTACPLCAATATPLPPFQLAQWNGIPKAVSLSPDGAHVLFESVLALTSGATDGQQTGTVNVYRSDHGSVQLEDVLPDGTPASGAVAGQGTTTGRQSDQYTPHVMSTDGTRTVFTADPTTCNTDAGTFVCGTLYLRDRSSGTPVTVQINRTEISPDPGGHVPAVYWDASDDDSRIFFVSGEQLVGTAGPGLFVYDVNAPLGSRLTHIGDAATAVLGVSADGHVAYFASSTQLLPGVPSMSGDESAIYAWTDGPGSPPGGTLRYVGMLKPFKALDASENAVSGTNLSFNQRQSRVSSDGRYLLFSTVQGSGVLSAHGGTDYDQGACSDLGIPTPGCRELYRYDLASDSLVCVSCRPDGSPPIADASVTNESLSGAARSSVHQNRALTADGSRVFFSTAEPLVPEDVNGRSDAYEWDATTGVHLLSDGVSDSDSYFLDASSNGDDVFIATRSQLVGWDTDQQYDVYDVRLPGPGHPAGFPEPPPPPADRCVQPDACRGSIPPPPGAPSIGSGQFRGPGDLANALRCGGGLVPRTVNGTTRCVVKRRPHKVRCRRGTVRRKVRGRLRCVKPKSRRSRHAARGGR